VLKLSHDQKICSSGLASVHPTVGRSKAKSASGKDPENRESAWRISLLIQKGWVRKAHLGASQSALWGGGCFDARICKGVPANGGLTPLLVAVKPNSPRSVSLKQMAKNAIEKAAHRPFKPPHPVGWLKEKTFSFLGNR
jgi:hypothetical protein